MELTVHCANCGYDNQIERDEDEMSGSIYCASCGQAVSIPTDANASDVPESLQPEQRDDVDVAPRHVRDYEILEQVGSGAMGTVYKAIHTQLDRIVALKLLPHERTQNPVAVARFERERKAVGKLDHPNIVRATDAGEIDGEHFLVMEFVDGLDLESLIQQIDIIPLPDACEMIRQASAGLQHAHEHGLVHRDIKPSNLMLTSTGTIKVLDLGLARLRDDSASGKELTVTGQILGTVHYMAPEQAKGLRHVDIRADIYSLGCTLFKLLTRTPPFGDDDEASALDILYSAANDPFPSVCERRPDVPQPFEDLLNQMVAKKPEDRPATPGEVARLLTPFCAQADLTRLIRQATEPIDRSTADGETQGLDQRDDSDRVSRQLASTIEQQTQIMTADEGRAETATAVAPRPVPHSKRLRWTYSVEPEVANPQPLRNCVAVDAAGRIFACIQNELVALAEENDQVPLVWKYTSGSYIPGSPCIGPDGNIRFHSCDGHLYCIDPDGALCWDPVRVGEPLGWASPVTDLESNTWICAYSGGLIKVDSSGQTTKRPFFRCPSKMDCTPMIHNNVLYVGTDDHFVYAIDLTGSRGRNCWNHSENHGRTGWFINSAPLLTAGEAIVVTSRDDHLYLFEKDGKPAWNLKLPGQAMASPVLNENEQVILGLSQIVRGQPDKGSLLCVDLRSRKVRWMYKANGSVESTPVIGDDGLIYFGDNAGFIHAVSPNGKASWSEDIGLPIRSAGAIAGKGTLVFGVENGSLVALQCDSEGLE